jgi:tetratricopeptide (TPR) repeat protein
MALPTPEVVAAGQRYVLTVPGGDGMLCLRWAHGADEEEFCIRVTSSRQPAWLALSRALRGEGKFDEAEQAARPGLASSDPGERAAALGMLARLALSQGRLESSFPLFREAIALGRGAGRLSQWVDDALALAYLLNQRSRHFGEARDLLAEVGKVTADYPDGFARLPYYEAVLSDETGDRRGALHKLEIALVRAERLGLSRLQRVIDHRFAVALGMTGQTAEALRRLAQIDEEVTASQDVPPCERVDVAINLGLAALQHNDQHGKGAANATGPLERAVNLTQGACRDPYLKASAASNLAMAVLQDGDPSRALALLRLAKTGKENVRVAEVLFQLDVEGWALLAQRDAGTALTRFDQAARLAEASDLVEPLWQAELGRGAALERLGRTQKALAAYRRAEDLLDRRSVQIPLDVGRGAYLGQRDRSARHAISLLVRLGRFAEALDVARTSRNRVVSSLEQSLRIANLDAKQRSRWDAALEAYRTGREQLDEDAAKDWTLPQDKLEEARRARYTQVVSLRRSLEAAMAVVTSGSVGQNPRALAPIDPDALTLAYHPGVEGWFGFAADHEGVKAFHVSSVDVHSPPAGLADQLFSPARDKIDRAGRIRILAYGSLRAIDMHRLPWPSAPLVAHASVEYPLDVALRRSRSEAGVKHALVVGDPNDDLTAARSEAKSVAQWLADQAVPKVELLLGPQATSAAVREGLMHADVFHYAGHGVFSGADGWQSALPLSGGGQLTTADILALERVPDVIVLSGCDASRVSEQSAAEGLGLAQAFAIAGASVVFAPSRPVRDDLASRFSMALLPFLLEPKPQEAAHTLSAFQAKLASELPNEDWSVFRTIRP